MPSRRTLLAFSLIFALYAALYARSLSYPFVWDDVVAIAENPLMNVSVWDGLRASQHDHIDAEWRTTVYRPVHDSWRPVLYLSYRLDSALWGISPAPMRAVNLLIGALFLLLVWRLARQWTGHEDVATAVTLALAVHPLLVEPVVYVSARADLLMATLVVASLVVADRGAADTHGTTASRGVALRLGHCVAAGVLLMLALLTKEAALGGVLAGGLIWWSRGQLPAYRGPLLAMGVATLVWLAARLTFGGGDGTSASAPDALAGLVHLPGSALRGLTIMLLPFDLSTGRTHNPSWMWPGIAATASALVLTALALRAPTLGRTARFALAGWWWIPVTIGPAAIVVVLMNTFADRYLLLPLVGVLIATGVGIQALIARRPQWRGIAALGVALPMVLWSVVSAIQVPTWDGHIKLYSHATSMAPESALSWYRLGTALHEAGDASGAALAWSTSAELDPTDVRAWNNVGVLQMRAGDFRAAEVTFLRGVEEGSNENVWVNLARIQLLMDRTSDACATLRRGLNDYPTSARARSLQAEHCSSEEAP